MKNIYSVVLLFISLVFLSGKEVDLVEKKEIREGKYAISDSLYYKTYNQLWKLFISHHKDSVFIKKLSNTYLSKAKKDKDSVKIANGYRIFLETNVNNSGVALMYADSMIAITKGIKHEYYPARGYLLKGYLLQRIEKYNEALDFYLIAKKYAEINKNMEHIIAIKHNIAILKTTLGKDQEALETHIENYNLLTTRDTVNTFRSEYIGTLYRLSDSYNRLQKYDTAQYYLKKGITASLSGDTPHFYPNLLSSYGVNSYYRNEYTSALDSLQKSIALSKESSYGNFVVTYLYLGKTLLKLNKEETSHYISEKGRFYGKYF